ncbi:3'(2'),5'-bisphosphate nucleotidase CysQ [Thiomicrorhabdus sp. zzn3]|uniref:3'(2'),5'-bisphosphate nucleotidase CysQ n=1 Tax=Thiomicrorhabdus sp. zzn3 TaxID=3039775 RepID=UPI002436B671|nr:3'(2'),5'-bisphosphate nucleotidase CysQ [Thiomicrorhabdus sp. zzn3]MDG6777264.1 3'(2'),5'-bisphosphate nucleotidase CysQ [Thiomicrorhabdus sp. zzn3]
MTLNSLIPLLPEVCRIAVEAGEQILQIYHHPDETPVDLKSDGTPVTIADQKADLLISAALNRLTPDIPLVSEESVSEIPFETRQAWSTFWLVDPLDGTKEFIEGTGEFSVNIALIHNQQPVLGVVYVPVTRVLYYAFKDQGAYKQTNPQLVPSMSWAQCFNPEYQISVDTVEVGRPVRVAVSRRHGSKINAFLDALGPNKLVRMGSAIKSCLVAEGAADVYPRFGPTSLWDTAAAQCVVEEAGGQLVDRQGNALRYAQSETLLNPYFMVVGDCRYSWPEFPQV